MAKPVTNKEDPGVESEAVEAGPEHAAESEAVGGADGLTDLPGSTGGQESVERSDAPSEDGSGSPAPGEEEAPTGNSELVALREEFDGLNDRHLRLVAEFNNFKRRSEQERLGAWSRAQADLLAKLLDVLDDLQRVAELDLGNATVDAIMEGIDLVERKFVRTLGDADVDMIDPSGERFDPELMEAMMRVPAESDDQVDTVAQVFQKGYSLKGILVRPARVSVFTEG